MPTLSDYWKARYEAEDQVRARSDRELENQLNSIYQNHAREIQKEIDSFWQRYADSHGITKLEAKKRADSLDMVTTEYKAKQLVERAQRLRDAGDIVTEANFLQAERELMKLYNLKMKTSRLEVLQANLKLQSYELAMNEYEATQKRLIEAVRQENLFSAGVLRDTLGSYQTPRVAAESLVHANFNGASWSQRLWERQDALQSIVKKGVQDTILRGKGTDLLIRQLEKEFKSSYSQARRLAVTETARVYSEAQKANYKANGQEQYMILAEVGACRICAPRDEKVYNTDEMTPGVNAAPFHPNCRCTTAPYSDRDKMWREIEGEKAYESVKDDWLADADPSKGKVSEQHYWEVNGVRYDVDGKNVIFNPTDREREVALLLADKLGRHVIHVPEVHNPNFVKTPDYLIDGIRWDLKEVEKDGKNNIDNAIARKKEQAHSFIIDVTKSPMEDEEIYSKINRIYSNANRRWLDNIILLDGSDIIDILKRK